MRRKWGPVNIAGVSNDSSRGVLRCRRRDRLICEVPGTDSRARMAVADSSAATALMLPLLS